MRNESPKLKNYGISIPNGYETHIATNPILAEAADSIRSIQKKIRQCIFEGENTLTYYR